MALQKELKALITIIKTGTPAEVKLAQRQVEHLWAKASQDEASRLKFSVFLDEAKTLDRIPDIDHKAYFINTLKWPLYFAQPYSFPAWTELLLKWVIHPEGKIRMAAVRVAQYLAVSMEDTLSQSSSDSNSQVPDQTSGFAKNAFCLFALHVDQLITQYHEPRFNRYKYISSLPAGVYKSLQQLLNDSLLCCDHLEKVYRDFLGKTHHQTPMPPYSHRQVGNA